LTPFVAETVEKVRTAAQGHEVYPKRFTGEDYLKAWKLMGGHDVVSQEDVAQEPAPRRNMPMPFEEKAGKA
jgi:large subunit ribosomal protein L41